MVEGFTVYNLMLDNSNVWDAAKVRNLFLPHEAIAILKIPLRSQPQPDKWIWTEERSVNFSVGSAYQLLLDSTRDTQGECSNSTPPIAIWKRIWRMRVPQKN